MTDNRDKNDPKAPTVRHVERQEERRARQAEALRRNLARRKAQSRGRDDGGENPEKSEA
ncbi:MAG: hypothetical protein HOM58_10120 [Rhodospirillaceae bacterium]|jgi:hypothetical protein|nr:hypothetical protein [Rhodospirillaceae bacterium]